MVMEADKGAEFGDVRCILLEEEGRAGGEGRGGEEKAAWSSGWRPHAMVGTVTVTNRPNIPHLLSPVYRTALIT
jgi:hypothetical protein